MGYVCGGEKTKRKKEKKKEEEMDDRWCEEKNNIKNKKWQLRNVTTIFSQ